MNISARQWLARADRAHRREDMEDFIERAAAGALVEIAETLEEISNALHKAQHAKYVAPYTGQPFTDRCDCCGNWQGHIIHVATNGWRYCDRCTDHHSFGTEGVV